MLFKTLLSVVLFALFVSVSPFITGATNDHSPQWSPTENRIAFLRSSGGTTAINVVNTESNDNEEDEGTPLRLATHRFVNSLSWSSDGTRVAYIAADNFSVGHIIVVVNSDGSNLREVAPVAPGAEVNIPLQWSPDGRQLLYASLGTLYVVEIETGTERAYAVGADYWPVPKWSPDGSKIAFHRTSESALWTVNTDGSNQQRIIVRPIISDFDWSPDGAKLLFINSPGGWDQPVPSDLGFVTIATLAYTHLTNDPALVEALWSPDGAKILFSASDDLYLINADGSQQTRLTTTRDPENSPRWSADGELIAFYRGYSDSQELFTIEVEGGETDQLLPGLWLYEGTSSLSPDFSQFLYLAGDPSYSELYTISPSGGETTPLSIGGLVSSFTWSPTGEKLLFHEYTIPAGEPGLFVINADGSNRVHVETEIYVYHFEWSPTGEKMLIVGALEISTPPVEYYIADADGSNLTKIEKMPGGEIPIPITWSSDGTRFAYVHNDLYVVDVTSGAQSNLTNDPGFYSSAVWQPNGNFIAYVGENGIMRISADGGEATTIYDGNPVALFLYQPSPDGSLLTFSAAAACCGQSAPPTAPHADTLYTIGWDGSGLFSWNLPFSTVVWSPASDYFLVSNTKIEIAHVASQSLVPIAEEVKGTASWAPDSRRIVVGNGDTYFGTGDLYMARVN